MPYKIYNPIRSECTYRHSGKAFTPEVPNIAKVGLISVDITAQITHPDIFRRICLYCTDQTLSRLLCVSSSIFDIARAILYDSLIPSPTQLSSIFAIPPLYIQKQHSPFSKTRLLSLVRHLTLSLHPHTACDRPGHHPPLPNVQSLTLDLDMSSPLGWTFCEPDRVTYPYYPITFPCRLLDRLSHLSHLSPRIVIIRNLRHFHSVSPIFGADLWQRVEEVRLEFWYTSVVRVAHYSGCFLSDLPDNVRRIKMRTMDGFEGRFLGDGQGDLVDLACLGRGWEVRESERADEVCLVRKGSGTIAKLER